MNKVKYLGVIIVIIIFAIIIVPNLIDRIKNNQIVENNRASSASPLSYIKINNEARKVPEFLFYNQDSLIISNEDFKDKIYVAEFFFTRCPSICPIMNNNMKRIENKFGKRNDFGIASFTIDPENDRPHVLKSYAESYDVFSNNWHFLTGNIKDVYSLANKGFNIFASINSDVAGGFEHQGFFALIDKKGFIRSRVDKFGNPIVYYLGIDEEGIDVQGTDLIIEDISKLLIE
ncbi:MAG: SCO family protein [Flavobacteriaceae bacterium]|nr:SCO family protein [Flavobacteriaceae bacterium]|tara:strand:- start:532 stop:1227 length:696 start_codon:yes stop_codon:yes gene_type:complete